MQRDRAIKTVDIDKNTCVNSAQVHFTWKLYAKRSMRIWHCTVAEQYVTAVLIMELCGYLIASLKTRLDYPALRKRLLRLLAISLRLRFSIGVSK